MGNYIHGVHYTKAQKFNDIDVEKLIKNEINTLFLKLDTNNTGYISEDKFIEALNAASQGKQSKEESKEYFNALDSNEDNKISKDEYKQFMLKYLKKELIENDDNMEDLKEQLHELDIEGDGNLQPTVI